ncbi:MAG: type II toxin-antitoxin system Phd/YefM family antitoxin [Microbacteriaceae bacterium]|nr:type II toxin-antitoxin system Phd/YefM family antitoxin [Microbacteriaceae bacterium]
METFAVGDATRRFAAIVTDVHANNSVVGISAEGRLAAVVLSAADYDELIGIIHDLGSSAGSHRREAALLRARDSDVVRRHRQVLAEVVSRE